MRSCIMVVVYLYPQIVEIEVSRVTDATAGALAGMQRLLARSVSIRSANGTILNVGTVSGALGLAMEWINAPLASRAP